MASHVSLQLSLLSSSFKFIIKHLFHPHSLVFLSLHFNIYYVNICIALKNARNPNMSFGAKILMDVLCYHRSVCFLLMRRVSVFLAPVLSRVLDLFIYYHIDSGFFCKINLRTTFLLKIL